MALFCTGRGLARLSYGPVAFWDAAGASAIDWLLVPAAHALEPRVGAAWRPALSAHACLTLGRAGGGAAPGALRAHPGAALHAPGGVGGVAALVQ